MLLYFLILSLALFVTYYTEKHTHNSKWVLFFTFLGLALFVGLSDMLGGYDRYIYGELFDDLADVMKGGGKYQDTIISKMYSLEYGYTGSNMLISYITGNRYFFILIYTLVIYILFYFSIRDYCRNYLLALMLFMGLTFFFTFTYLRQMMGVGIAWLSFRYVYKRSLYKFIVCVLLAASFHNSAIILLPLYFIPIRKYNKKNIIIFMFICLIIGLTGGPSALFRVYGDVADMQVRSDSYIEKEIGFKFEYIIEACVFLYLLLKNYSFVSNSKKDLVMQNALLAFCAILLLFVKSLNGGRLGWYYLIGVIATFSNLNYRLRITKSTKTIIAVISLVLFIRILVQWDYMLSPYKTFLTNGVRDYDPVYDKYEYDQNYAIDKFYRK